MMELPFVAVLESSVPDSAVSDSAVSDSAVLDSAVSDPDSSVLDSAVSALSALSEFTALFSVVFHCFAF